MASQGWIKLHRELIDKAIWKTSTPEQKIILITLLLMANHEENEWEWNGERFKVQPGQMITSLKSIAEACGKGVTIQNVRTAIDRFEKYEFLTNQSTKRNRLITIVNYEKYQGINYQPNKATNNQLTNDQQSTNNRLTTNKNDKNDKNDKEEYARAREVTEFFNLTAGKNYNVNDCKPYVDKLISRGYKVEDIKHVIQVKSEQWKGDQKMNQYLRPMTLFGDKFSSYLQEQSTRMKGVLYL